MKRSDKILLLFQIVTICTSVIIATYHIKRNELIIYTGSPTSISSIKLSKGDEFNFSAHINDQGKMICNSEEEFDLIYREKQLSIRQIVLILDIIIGLLAFILIYDIRDKYIIKIQVTIGILTVLLNIHVFFHVLPPTLSPNQIYFVYTDPAGINLPFFNNIIHKRLDLHRNNKIEISASFGIDDRLRIRMNRSKKGERAKNNSSGFE